MGMQMLDRRMKSSCFSFGLAILLLISGIVFDRCFISRTGVLLLNSLSWFLFLSAFLLSKKSKPSELRLVVRFVSFIFIFLPFVLFFVVSFLLKPSGKHQPLPTQPPSGALYMNLQANQSH